MRTELSIYKGTRLLQTIPITWRHTIDEIATYDVQYKDLPHLPDQKTIRERRRRRNRNLLDNIADPERGFPILRSLIQKFAPILIEYLMKQLPIWLADVEDLDQDETIA